MSKLIKLLYGFFLNLFHKFRSDKFTSFEGAVTLTAGSIILFAFILLDMLSIYLFNFNLIKDVNKWIFVIVMGFLITIVSNFVKKIVKQKNKTR
ncbi:MAG: hypothetical protein RLZZ323_1726 [Bacteroidota bacterium]|jgi:hypothetical protein